jgi:hypothetical protein
MDSQIISALITSFASIAAVLLQHFLTRGTRAPARPHVPEASAPPSPSKPRPTEPSRPKSSGANQAATKSKPSWIVSALIVIFVGAIAELLVGKSAGAIFGNPAAIGITLFTILIVHLIRIMKA